MTRARDLANIIGSGATSSGVITAATLEATGDTAAGDNAAIGFTSDEGLILTGQGGTSDITLKNDADATVFTVPTGTDDILFPDNAKAMFGAGSDLQIFHDGLNSYITDSGTGALAIQTNGTAIVLEQDNGENMILANVNADVKLYYNGNQKLATTATGIDVTGAITVGGAALGGGAMEFIASSGAISNAASVAFTQFDASKYDHYKFMFQYVIPVNDAVFLYAFTSTNGGTSYDTGASDYHNFNDDRAHAMLTTGIGSGSNEYGISGVVNIYAPHLTNAYTYIDGFRLMYEQSSAYTGGALGTGAYATGDPYGATRRNSTADVDAIKFQFSGGNIESGEIVMYGIVNGS